MFLHGGSGDDAFVDIGRGAEGDGSVSVSRATLRLQNDGVGFDGTTYGTGGFAGMQIGRDGGTGSLTLTNRAKLILDATDIAYLNIASDMGTGVLSANRATIDVSSAEDVVNFTVGLRAGADGLVELENKTRVTIDGTTTLLGIGYGGEGATGAMMVTGSTVRLIGSDAALVALGTSPGTATNSVGPGTGTLTLDRSSLLAISTPGEAGLWIGAEAGGTGTMTVTRESMVTFSDNAESEVLIGTNGGTGRLTVTADSRVTGFDAAEIGGSGGSGLLTLLSGGQFGEDGAITTLQTDGVIAADQATLGGDLVLNGGQLDMRGRDLAQLQVTGDAAFAAGSVRMDIGAAANDSLLIGGAAQLEASSIGETTLFDLRLIEGRTFAANDSVTLVEAGTLQLGAGRVLDASVSGAASGFSWMFGVQTARPDALILTALNGSDAGSGATGTLAFTNKAAATATWDADISAWVVSGGGWDQAVADNLGPLVGTKSADRFDANDIAKDVQFEGGGGKDRLVGGTGSDTLNGGAGKDVMLGGAANDLYIVDNKGDRVFETTTTTSLVDAGGVDSVQSAVSFNLDANAGVRFVENLTLTGSANINGTGNALANVLIGNKGDNKLVGGAGGDTLNGGSGDDTLLGGNDADTFVFKGAFGTDVIRDFDRLQVGEVIDLSAVSSIVDFADLVSNHLTQSGSNAVITAGSHTITLVGVEATDLLADDFLF